MSSHPQHHLTEKDSTFVPLSNSPAPLRPHKLPGVALARLADLAQAAAGAPGGASPGTAGAEVHVTGVSLDSRAIVPGDLYVARPGARTHGAVFAAAAVAAGAVAVVTDDAGSRLLPTGCTVPVLVVPDVSAVTGSLAAAVYGGAAALDLFAVTGTNGKTTTTYFLTSLLQALGKDTGLIGTIEILVGSEAIPSRLTTPESTEVHALLAVMAERGLNAASMEVSSHALTFGRVDGVHFDVAGFTNLTQDHLDLHGDMAGYFATKAQLFTPEHARRAVICVDDEWGRRLAGSCSVPAVTLSTHPAGGDAGAAGADPAPQGHWRVAQVQRQRLGSSFTLLGPGGAQLKVKTGLPGAFNVSNAALALVMVAEQLFTAQDRAVVLARLQAALDQHDPFTVEVPGRMQLVGSAPVAVVDFAHNPDALARAMEAVRPATAGGRLILVFGATGERDATKRPIMGAVAVAGAEVVIVTDDDPHDEDPATIRAQVMAGAVAANTGRGLNRVVEECALRPDAIVRAVELATAQDVILVAGRGHEVHQEVKGINISLDDRLELRTALASRGFQLTKTSAIES
ncbi:UDP-N-acetylmuramoyl-L-alanyl-D-glutamate--2,6-diaminopimelate ligase [Specibacter sp. NPDC057265]|uniref:UDP-N-acetylmuramoyl-L-alanyl-D-glutamate--2, 6-diaminopimelate ligase n=1 Tax=Specibacter sp. NPDC057265 TaxID=3346075 RepID=UPI00362597CD